MACYWCAQVFQAALACGAEPPAGDGPLPHAASAEALWLPAEEEGEETGTLNRPQDLQGWQCRTLTIQVQSFPICFIGMPCLLYQCCQSLQTVVYKLSWTLKRLSYNIYLINIWLNFVILLLSSPLPLSLSCISVWTCGSRVPVSSPSRQKLTWVLTSTKHLFRWAPVVLGAALHYTTLPVADA